MFETNIKIIKYRKERQDTGLGAQTFREKGIRKPHCDEKFYPGCVT